MHKQNKELRTYCNLKESGFMAVYRWQLLQLVFFNQREYLC